MRPDITYENHLKGEYAVENGDDSMIITSSSCYRMKEETLSLIDNLPRWGSRTSYIENLSSMGIEKADVIFDRLMTIGALRVKQKSNLIWKIALKLIRPDVRLLPAAWQEKALKAAGISLSRGWLRKNLKTFLFLAAAGTVLSLVISFTGIYPALAKMSSGQPETAYLVALVLLGSLVHEIGHSFAAAAFGLGFRPIGFAVYLIYPVFYTNVSGMEKLSMPEKAAIDCGGFFSQSAYLLFLLLLWCVTRNMFFLEPVRWIALIMVFNLNPFLRTDGYWLYKDVRKGLENNKFVHYFHYAYLAAFFGFSIYLFLYISRRIEPICMLLASAWNEPTILLHEGYKIILGCYLLILFFAGGVRRLKETRQEWLELRNRNKGLGDV